MVFLFGLFSGFVVVIVIVTLVRGNLHMSELADRDHLKYNKTFAMEVVLLLFVQLKADSKTLDSNTQ